MRARLAILLLSSLLFSCGKSDNAPSGAPIAVAQSGGPIGQNPTTYSLVTGIVGLSWFRGRTQPVQERTGVTVVPSE